ncbi:hypothetical protein QZH41_008914 [Actinostola sp. cb2023]|nr:hypothetical protein QZH41_008914 [Actinostola sp. cb2023]
MNVVVVEIINHDADDDNNNDGGGGSRDDDDDGALSTASYLQKQVAQNPRCRSSPKKLPDIGTFFKYNGTEVVTGIVSDRWIWFAGGRNSGQPINSYIWNSIGDKPLQYRMYLPGSEMTKTSRNFQAYAGLFNPGTPDPEVFELPSYCEKEFERYPKPNLEDDAIFDSNWWQPS